MNKVWLLTTGSGSDGDEWNVKSIHRTRDGAVLEKERLDSIPNKRDDGTIYYNKSFIILKIEEWELNA